MATDKEPGTITLEDNRFKLTFNAEHFWSGIQKAIVSTVDGDAGSAGEALLNALGSFSNAKSNEHKAYRLVYSALHKACVAVLTDSAEQERLVRSIINAGVLSTAFYQNMSRKLGAAAYSIGPDFFIEPHRSAIIKDAKADFHSYLRTALGLNEAHAGTLSAALPGNFVRELAIEWERGDYKSLTEFFDNPFLESYRQMVAREARHADLLRLFSKPAFNDP
ncbi:MAG: hypothetical protein KDC61_09355, partial [Saprospiraceae bacterium]|nr:hypothetical protein [Saprospiraceae bacterium]